MTVPAQAAATLWSAKLDAAYRLMLYPATGPPLDKVLAAQLTVTALPAETTVGVAPWLTLAAADAPFPPGRELALQYAQAAPAVRLSASDIAISGRSRVMSLRSDRPWRSRPGRRSRHQHSS